MPKAVLLSTLFLALSLLSKAQASGTPIQNLNVDQLMHAVHWKQALRGYEGEFWSFPWESPASKNERLRKKRAYEAALRVDIDTEAPSDHEKAYSIAHSLDTVNMYWGSLYYSPSLMIKNSMPIQIINDGKPRLEYLVAKTKNCSLTKQNYGDRKNLESELRAGDLYKISYYKNYGNGRFYIQLEKSGSYAKTINLYCASNGTNSVAFTFGDIEKEFSSISFDLDSARIQEALRFVREFPKK